MEAKSATGESKIDGEDKGGGEDKARMPSVDITRIDIEAGPSPLTSGLDLEVAFTTDTVLPDAVWQVKYLVDSVYTRHVIRTHGVRSALRLPSRHPPTACWLTQSRSYCYLLRPAHASCHLVSPPRACSSW